MKLEQLRYFLVLARHQHLGRAALDAAISPSAISHSIQNLEAELGHKLFVKKGRGIQLTEHGALLITHAEELLDKARTLKQCLGQTNQVLQGHYRLAATHGYCEQLLTPAWMKLANENPLLTAEISSYRSHDVVSKVISGEIDFGLCICPHQQPHFQSQLLWTEKLVIGVAKDHPLLHSASFDMTQLQDYPAAVAKSASSIVSCEAHPMFSHFNLQPENKLFFDSYHTLVAAIKNSHHWALLPESVFAWHPNQIEAIPLDLESCTIQIVAIWPKHRNISPLINRLIERLKPNKYTQNTSKCEL